MGQGYIKTQGTIKGSVSNIIDKVAKDINFGKLTYSVNTHWEGGALCKAQIRKAHSLVVDEQPEFGGCDLGASPVELILAALGTSQEIMYSRLASIMDIELEECDVRLTADLDMRGLLGIKDDESIPPGFLKINNETTIKSSASNEELQTLINAVEKQCPVLDILTRNVKIIGAVKIEGNNSS